MPVYLGATVNHNSMWITCDACGSQGYTNINKEWGTTAYLTSLLTFGLGIFCPIYDTKHYCKFCGEHIGTAKYM